MRGAWGKSAVVVGALVFACGGSVDPSEGTGSTAGGAGQQTSSPPPAPPPPPCTALDGMCVLRGMFVCAADWALGPGSCADGFDCCLPSPGTPAPAPPANGKLLCWNEGPYPPGLCAGRSCAAGSSCSYYTWDRGPAGGMATCYGGGATSADGEPAKGTCMIANCGTIRCSGTCLDQATGSCQPS